MCIEACHHARGGQGPAICVVFGVDETQLDTSKQLARGGLLRTGDTAKVSGGIAQSASQGKGSKPRRSRGFEAGGPSVNGAKQQPRKPSRGHVEREGRCGRGNPQHIGSYPRLEHGALTPGRASSLRAVGCNTTSESSQEARRRKWAQVKVLCLHLVRGRGRRLACSVSWRVSPYGVSHVFPLAET